MYLSNTNNLKLPPNLTTLQNIAKIHSYYRGELE